MNDWVATNMAFDEVDNSGIPALEPPQEDLECRLCFEVWSSEYSCETKQWEVFFIPSYKCIPENSAPILQNQWKEVDGKPCSKEFAKSTGNACGQDLDCLPSGESEMPGPPPSTDMPVGCCGRWCVLADGNRTGDCSEGSISAHETEQSSNEAEEFRPDEFCDSQSCPVDRYCFNDWMVKYNCDLKKWESIGDSSFRFCVYIDTIEEFALDQWREDPADCLYMSYGTKGESCVADSECPKIGFSEGPSEVSGFDFDNHPAPSDCCPEQKFHSLIMDEWENTAGKLGDFVRVNTPYAESSPSAEARRS
jgi:hypothetical protein